MKSSLGLLCFATALLFSSVTSAQWSHNFGDSAGYAGVGGYEASAFQPEVADELYGDMPGGMPYTENPYGPGMLGQGGPRRIRGRMDGSGMGSRMGGGGQRGGGGLIGGRSGNRNATAAGRPGRFWADISVADRGLGYEGSYASLGGKKRLIEGRFGGRWLVEGNVHHSVVDNGGFFSNIGLERVFSIDAANADITTSVWYDYDADMQANFSHDFHQVGASAGIKTPKWDLLGNGYFPVGTTDYTYGDLTGANCFVDNRIVMIPGIDSALEGFDVTLRIRPDRMRIVNGTIDFGAYSYSSDIIKSFGGGRVRAGFQVFRGMMVNAEVNHDERFDTTGVVSFGWLFGANASGAGHEYTLGGRDLEQTVRNDHIVRFNQDVVLAMDPETGLAYNVVHVDNTATAAETGDFESPFASLAAAEAASAAGDIIFVNAGDGTDTNMDAGIVLKDNQKLFGTGVENLLAVQNGQFFRLCNDPTGDSPTISNDGGAQVISLADNNDISGFNIDATGAGFGIFGDSVDGGTIRDTTIADATSDGVRLSGVTGNWDILRNTVTDSGRDGIYVLDSLDPTSIYNVADNTVTGSVFDGIHFENFNAAEVNLARNTTNTNVRAGLFLEDYANFSGTGVINVTEHTAVSNLGRGMHFLRGIGTLNVLDSTVTDNLGAGVTVENWLTVTDQLVTIGTTTGGASSFQRNGGFANVDFVSSIPGVITNALVTNQTIDTGVNGIVARVGGIDIGTGQASTLNIDIVDNLAINDNLNNGIVLGVDDGGIINANINSSDPAAPQQIVGNSIIGGAGIAILTDGAIGQAASEVNAVIDNVFENSGGPDTVIARGVFVVGLNNSKVDVAVSNSTLGDTTTESSGVRVLLDNVFNPGSAPLVNRIALKNLTINAGTGVGVFTGDETSTDFSLEDSTMTDALGVTGPGVIVTSFGDATATGAFFMPNYPEDNIGALVVPELVSDGVADNLTRVLIRNNSIQGFSENGVDLRTSGDAEMLVNLAGNRITGNGAGDGTVPFFDGVNVDAFDDSNLTAEVSNNLFQGNFERGLSLNTQQQATLTASMVGNVLIGNDVGEDPDDTIPPIGTGTESGPTGPIVDSGLFDFEAINNEEFYFREYESLIVVNGAGDPVDLAGDDLPDDTAGVPFPDNGPGFDVFGVNPDIIGSFATLNLAMSENTFTLGLDMQDFSLAPGDFVLALDGFTNGFAGPVPPLTPGVYDFTVPIIDGVEAIFAAGGFVSPTH